MFKQAFLVAIFLLFAGVAAAQTPLASCRNCGDSGWELYVGGAYTTFEHWYDGTRDSFKDLQIYSGQRDGHQFKLITSLDIPVRGSLVSGVVLGVNYYSQEHEDFFNGYDWNQEGVEFTLGFKFKL